MNYRKLSALVAGDNAATRSVISSLLLGLGVGDVRQAPDGGEAFREIRARTPDFVLLDFEMERDALTTLQQIRRSPDSPRSDLPVGIAVAFVTKAAIELMMREGVSGVLLKPTTSQKLNACIQSMLSDKRKAPLPGSGKPDQGDDDDDGILKIDIA